MTRVRWVSHVRMLVASFVAAAVMLVSTGVLPAQASIPAPSELASSSQVHVIKLGPKAEAALRKLTSTAAGRTALQRALEASFGKLGRTGVSSPVSSGHSTPDIVCGGVQCGLSGAGGEHFWVIATYAAIAVADISVLAWSCTGILSASITPWVAKAVCFAGAAALSTMAANWPRFTNAGVWIAVYFWPPHWAGGRWAN